MCMSAPSVPSPDKTMGKTLAAQIKYAPQIYAMNAEYAPLYNQLGLKNLSSYLTGINGEPGMLDLYANNIMPALTAATNAANTSARTSAVNDAQSLVPSLTALARSANPTGANLLDTVSANTSRDLSYGHELTPEEKVRLNQSVRGAAASRGMGMGPDAVFDESMANQGMGEQLYQGRMASAQNLVPQLSQFYGNPLAMLGISSGNDMNSTGMTGLARSSMAPTMLSEFNPESATQQQYASQLYDSNSTKASNNNGLMMMGIKAGMGGLQAIGQSGL